MIYAFSNLRPAWARIEHILYIIGLEHNIPYKIASASFDD